jgi:hypothetical protein
MAAAVSARTCAHLVSVEEPIDEHELQVNLLRHGMAWHPLRHGALQFNSRTAAPIHPTRYAMLPQCQPNAALLK